MSTTSHVNFYGGAPLNRLSWLRESNSFLNTAAESPLARWILFLNGDALIAKQDTTHSIGYLSTNEVIDLLGKDDPIFGQGEEVNSPPPSDDDTPKCLQGARLRGPTIVFLGALEKEGTGALPTKEFKSAADLPGPPYFAVDVSKVDQGLIDQVLKSSSVTHEFIESRAASSRFTTFDAAVFSLARSMMDWNGRNKFCPGCGSRNYSLWGGWKLLCSTLLPWSNNEGKEPCLSAKGLHNFAHPRTDSVVITAILDDKADRILLGHNKRFPPGNYSTLAGFVEPSESFEESVRREMYEESGIQVHTIQYDSCQPWPYPANLMIGFYAWADSSQTIRTDLDTELGGECSIEGALEGHIDDGFSQDARWFTREESQLS
ncbi:NADH pyrophosphatase [Tulasnella sp. 418]|nr:NADH pyrophosphatase [Tulasnella sp. 418]